MRDLCSLVKVQPVLSEVFDDGVADTGVVLVVEDGEVLQEVGNDDVEEEDRDQDVVRDEPECGSHHVPAIPVQLRAVVVPNLRLDHRHSLARAPPKALGLCKSTGYTV